MEVGEGVEGEEVMEVEVEVLVLVLLRWLPPSLPHSVAVAK